MKAFLRRIVMLLLTMILVSLLTFIAFELISGDAATAILGTEATPERLEALREELGLNRPLPARYLEWLIGFFTGNLGVSTSYHQPVWDLIAPKVLVTLYLSLLSFALIAAVSIPAGLWSASHSGGALDGFWTAFNQFCMSIPPFFTGIVLSWCFGILLKWFTPGEFPDASAGFLETVRYLLFAAVSLAIPRIAMTVRMLRSTIQAEMQKDYVRTAISRGNTRAAVLYRHVLKNAFVPVTAFLAQTMAEIVAGSIVVEQVFSIPGLGRILVASISNRDYPTVQAIVVILAFWVVLAGMAADLACQRMDPRLRLGGGA